MNPVETFIGTGLEVVAEDATALLSARLSETKQGLLTALHEMWAIHDVMERALIKLERHFTDAELEEILSHDE